MNLIKFLKKCALGLPFSIGSLLAQVPYERKPFLGKTYRQRKQEIADFESFDADQKRAFVFERVKLVTEHAFNNVPFYKKHYSSLGFHPSELSSFESISQIPVIRKRDLIEVPIEDRISNTVRGGRVAVNTGGSTGAPLNLVIQTDSYGHEKAHMNHIWGKLGFRDRDSILTFSGRSQLKTPIQYDGLRHAFMVDIYQPIEALVVSLRLLRQRERLPRFLHGYPSAIFEFLTKLKAFDHELSDALSNAVDGVFFGSEYPNPQWRKEIENLSAAPSVSWYGHTERCVLAYEARNQFEYEPLQTYGFAESVSAETGQHLVGTSYYNFVCPMIRYDTEDGIDGTGDAGGILNSFKIVDGRLGEYVLDGNGTRIPLTGLIYGRHHQLFNFCRSIQISQDKPGFSTVYYCVLDDCKLPQEVSRLFDTSGVAIQFEFVAVDAPIRTKAGKIGLLIDAMVKR